MSKIYKIIARIYRYFKGKYPNLFASKAFRFFLSLAKAYVPSLSYKVKVLSLNNRASKEFQNLNLQALLPAQSSKQSAIRLLKGIEMMAERDNDFSLVPSIKAWRDKWKNCQGKRILYYSYIDFSGSFYKWADAVNEYTPHAVRLVVLNLHKFGYPVDIVYPRADVMREYFPVMYDALLTLADEADIIHIKDQKGFLEGYNALPPYIFRQFNKPLIYTLYGGHARHEKDMPAFRGHVQSFDAVVAMTPDLCFDWAKTAFIPHSIDCNKNDFLWEDKGIIVHTPSTPSRKGTDLFLAACQELSQTHDVDYKIITGVTYEMALENKRKATLFFDQAGKEAEKHGGSYIGWYGNSALEAAVHGVPTMAYMSDMAFEQAARAGRDIRSQCGMLNVEPSKDGIRRVMEMFFDMSPDERKKVALKTRAWIKSFHSQQAVAKMLSDLYEQF